MKNILFILLLAPLSMLGQTWKVDSAQLVKPLSKTELYRSGDMQRFNADSLKIWTASLSCSEMMVSAIRLPLQKITLYTEKGECVGFDENGKIYINNVKTDTTSSKVYELIKDTYLRQLKEKEELKGRFLTIVNMPILKFDASNYKNLSRDELIELIERQNRLIQQLFQIN